MIPSRPVLHSPQGIFEPAASGETTRRLRWIPFPAGYKCKLGAPLKTIQLNLKWAGSDAGDKKAQIRVAVHRGNAAGNDRGASTQESTGPIGNVGNINHSFSKARLNEESSEVGGCLGEFFLAV